MTLFSDIQSIHRKSVSFPAAFPFAVTPNLRTFSMFCFWNVHTVPFIYSLVALVRCFHIFTFHLHSLCCCCFFVFCLEGVGGAGGWGGFVFLLLSALTAHRPTLPLGPSLKWKLPCFGLGFNGSAFSRLQYPLTVWLPVPLFRCWRSSSPRFIRLPHASKDYFTP